MHGVHTTGSLPTDFYFDFFGHPKCNYTPLLIWKIFLRCPTRIFSQCFDLLHWNPVQTVTRLSCVGSSVSFCCALLLSFDDLSRRTRSLSS
jgi:hypothetical protein